MSGFWSSSATDYRVEELGAALRMPRALASVTHTVRVTQGVA
jgi:hypothetical protein